jgi:hypothetical protein
VAQAAIGHRRRGRRIRSDVDAHRLYPTTSRRSNAEGDAAPLYRCLYASVISLSMPVCISHFTLTLLNNMRDPTEPTEDRLNGNGSRVPLS